MGEVYRARDIRLDRTVAIKILPAHLAADAAARQRFEREARTISSVQHPNICVLYDIGHQDGTDYLVMEFLEGETLADRLRKGPMPLDQVLKCGMEICDGLERAHRSGVIHRDLKPGNIILTRTGAKILDFGLAKPAVMAHPPISELTQTLSAPNQPLTTEGTLVGTFQYMSPEQIEGKEADVRSDIFALGSVLYEMITGRRAFEGKTSTSTIAAILASNPPPLSDLQPPAPAPLQNIVNSCLAKDPDDRLQTTHDVKLQLKWIAEAPAAASTQAIPSARGRFGMLGWTLAGVLALLCLGGGFIWWRSATEHPPALFFSSATPMAVTDVTLSPDGLNLAAVAYSDQAHKNMIWTQPVGAREPLPLPGTEGASHPFWSPDGHFLAFFAQGKLMKIDAVSGRFPQVLCDAPFGRGGSWNRDGVIIFSPDAFTGLFRISAAGGSPVPITHPDPKRLETSHRWPRFLPDQRHFLFLGANFSGQVEKNGIYVGSLDSAETRLILSASSNPVYTQPGYLLYWRDHALVAQTLDPRTFVLSGEPHTILARVQYFPQTDLAVYDARGGTLVAQTGAGTAKSQFTWFDRSGKQLQTVGTPDLFSNIKLSPDGKRIAVDQTDADGRHVNVWIHDLASQAAARLGFFTLEQLAVWSPDGKRVIFTSNQRDHFSLFERNSDGSGSDQEVADSGDYVQNPWDWSHDGKYLLIRIQYTLRYLSLADGQMHPLLDQGTPRNAQFSPDGKWFAYASNETGSWEIYVSPFPNPSSKWQVSRGGGEEPRWRRDGKELFYLSANRELVAVPVKTGASFEAGPPAVLFPLRARQPISAMDFFTYDVGADGQRFLINAEVENSPVPLSIVLHWTSEMQR